MIIPSVHITSDQQIFWQHGFVKLNGTIVITWAMMIAPHLFPELNVQLLASIPNGLWIEDMGLADDLFVDPVPVVKGMIAVPERPGHGLAFKPEILRDCAVGAASR